jgi:hypothetical protein
MIGTLERHTAFSLASALLLCSALARADVCVYKPPSVRGIRGVVVDPGGRGISGAAVSVSKNDSLIASTQSNESGKFAIARLPSGAYEVQINAKGFATANYTVKISHPPTFLHRGHLRIQLAVGGNVCDGDIRVRR